MKRETKHRLLLMFATLMFCIIRFGHVYADSLQYILYTDVILSGNLSSITGPFVYRPLLPMLLLLFEGSVDIALIMSIFNIGILCMLTDSVYHICGILTLDKNMRFLGTLITVASYPLAFFGPVPLVDAAAMLVFVLVIACAECNYGDETVAVIIFFGVFVKEIILLLGLYYVVRLGWKKFWVLIPGIVGHLCLRIIIPRENTLIFTLNILERPIEVLGMFGLTFGVPLLIIVIAYLKGYVGSERGKKMLIAGMLASLPIVILGLFFAYFDGRFIWPVLIMSGLYIVSIERKKNVRK